MTLWQIVVLLLANLVNGNVFNVINPPAYFFAPYTPFINDSLIQSSINFSAIPLIVDTAIDNGVNIFWIGGSMAQFDTQSVDERKAICSAFMESINNHSSTDNIYTIFHVGATRINDCVELAKYSAEDCGVDAIGSLAPYYNRVSTSDNFIQLFSWFKPMINASNNLPFWYYHYPSKISYTINIADLINEAITNNGLPQLEGIKYNNDNTNDYFQSTDLYSDQIAIVPYYTPDLGLFAIDKGFGYGSADYFMPVIKCMKNATDSGDIDTAYLYQRWKLNVSEIITSPVANRCVYQRWGIEFGPPRPPLLPYSQNECNEILTSLDNMDFYNQLDAMKNDPICPQTLA